MCGRSQEEAAAAEEEDEEEEEEEEEGEEEEEEEGRRKREMLVGGIYDRVVDLDGDDVMMLLLYLWSRGGLLCAVLCRLWVWGVGVWVCGLTKVSLLCDVLRQ